VQQEQPIEIVINPRGSEIRGQRRIWNNGDGRMRLYTVGSGDALMPPADLPRSAVFQSMDETFGNAFSRMPLF
jgi:hypothetical protein